MRLFFSVVYLLCLSLPFPHISKGQNINWNHRPQKGIVFIISNDEAEHLLRQTKKAPKFENLLDSVFDTFDPKQGWIDRPKQGHFILGTIERNKMHCEYTAVFPYQVFLFKEYDSFAIQVLDAEGNVREDAKVKLRRKRIWCDRESKTYRWEAQWFRGDDRRLTVELDGFRSVFRIYKHRISRWFQNDGFNPAPEFYSYMITDKNKYRPGDLVRFKSYALSQSRWPLRRDLELRMWANGKYTKLLDAERHRPGGYTGGFVLHDSLNLALDKHYSIQLLDKKKRIVANCGFKYEDYELQGEKLETKLKKSVHHFQDDNELIIKATDENGLLLKDAKASILVKTSAIQNSFQQVLTLPDTLIYKEMKLDPAAPTKIKIPAALFQKSKTNYTVSVTVLNNQNRRLESSEHGFYAYSNYDLTSYLLNDTICFDLLENGKPTKGHKIEIRKNGRHASKTITLPYKELINPADKVYSFKSKLLSKEFSMSNLTPKLKLLGGVEKDSFNITLENPQQIEVSWFVYKGDELMTKGCGKEIEYKSLIEDRFFTYYVDLFYSFGGEEHSKSREFVFKEKFLNVELDVPSRVYPGQKVDATIRVTDDLGQPVRGVDLTALSTTSKLSYKLPNLPYYGSKSLSRERSDYFSKHTYHKPSTTLPLNYKRWKKLAGLDTMMYYNFTYPRDYIFRHTTPIKDSTQFAPYVMEDGKRQMIYAIEMNRQPIYYSWVDQPSQYSFYADPSKKYQLTLRLADRLIVLDSMQFEQGKKTVFSLEMSWPPEGSKVYKLNKRFNSSETERFKHLISKFEVERNTYAYLQSGNKYTPLFDTRNSNHRHKTEVLIGPVKPKQLFYIQDSTYQIKYWHSGNFKHRFDANVVYKLDTYGLWPNKLNQIGSKEIWRINDLVLRKDSFLAGALQRKKHRPAPWLRRSLNISQWDQKIKIRLPHDHARSGLFAVLLENIEDKRTTAVFHKKYGTAGKVQSGLNNIIVLYNNGNYLKMDSVNFRKHSQMLIDFNKSKLLSKDSASIGWKKRFKARNFYNGNDFFRSAPRIQAYSYKNITGTVTDENGEPLPCVTVAIKGATTGTITDFDGKFTLDIETEKAILIFSFVGYQDEEIEVEAGSEISVMLKPEEELLQEVVVVGYGTSKQSSATGAVARISSAPAGKVGNESEEEITAQDVEEQIYQELLTLNTVRSNFSDVGFWEPKLYTDRQGESKFEITFPDDITQWNALVYAMNRRLQTGTARKKIKSYKPLMAKLHTPRFLTRGDSADFLGEVLNYTKDTLIQGNVDWSGASADFKRPISFNQYHSNKLIVHPTSLDSMKTRYIFSRNDGYMDGEERSIPVFEQGAVRAKGSLSILKNGDNKGIKAEEGESITVKIFGNQIEIYEHEVKHLIRYRYACNEQLASKLIGLLNAKLIAEYNGKKFKHEKHIKKIIKRLLDNQNDDRLWSWWGRSQHTSYWMSAHILRALKKAKDAGYWIDLDTQTLESTFGYMFNVARYVEIRDIDILNALANWDIKLNYQNYLNRLDSLILAKDAEYHTHGGKYYNCVSHMHEKLLLQEIRQMKGLNYQRDTLLKYRQESMLGEISFGDNLPNRYWYHDDLNSQLVAYRLIGRDSSLIHLKAAMQMHILSLRKKRRWNTYQSSNAVMSILPDLLKAGVTKEKSATVNITGKENKTISKFPYNAELESGEELLISKKSGLPLFYMDFKEERVTEAKIGVKGFEIESYFKHRKETLQAGKPVDLIVEVKVTKKTSMENVMLEIPIPAACSYANKWQPSYYGVETHREYFKDRTAIFCEKMQQGEYKFRISLLPRFTGNYILNPAQISLMYVPVVNANTDMRKVRVMDDN